MPAINESAIAVMHKVTEYTLAIATHVRPFVSQIKPDDTSDGVLPRSRCVHRPVSLSPNRVQGSCHPGSLVRLLAFEIFRDLQYGDTSIHVLCVDTANEAPNDAMDIAVASSRPSLARSSEHLPLCLRHAPPPWSTPHFLRLLRVDGAITQRSK